MASRKHRRGTWGLKDERLFTLEVFIIGGPMTNRFIKKNKVISRTIQIRGDQTLEDLHYAIFGAFKRFEQHMYEFQVGGKGPTDLKARRYVLSGAFEDPMPGTRRAAGDVAYTTLGSLGLKVGDAFGYWFDFGDDWWHQINVAAIEEKAGRGKYPRVTKRVGARPPQYVDWEDEDDE
jgi:hypothetical protein